LRSDAGRPVDRSGKGDARADHPLTSDSGLGQRPGNELGRRVEALRRFVVDVELDRALGEDRRGEVRDRDAHADMSERDPDGGARRRVEREHNRRPPARTP
jgi:hypothetical protein